MAHDLDRPDRVRSEGHRSPRVRFRRRDDIDGDSALATALGLGLAVVAPGRSELVEGFGVIRLASLVPMIAVIGFILRFIAESEG